MLKNSIKNKGDNMKLQINGLISELFGGKFNPDLNEDDIVRIMNQDNVYTFFHLEDGKVVGMVVLYIVELFSRKLGVIEEVVTLHNYRNRGIGSSLLQRAIDKAKELKLTCLELTVRKDKPETRKFYEKIGFYNRNNTAMRLWLNKGRSVLSFRFMKNMTKISVVITVKNDSMAVWHTFNSIFSQLTKYENFDIIIVDDSSDDFALQEYFNRPNLDKRVKYYRVSFDTTATTRGYGINLAQGGLVLCLDSHVILGERAIDKILEFFNDYKTATIGFIPLIRYPGSKMFSHHKVHWDTDFWFDWLEPKEKSFKCASGGHGAFVIKKEAWDKIGGYYNGFIGYGGSGEEIYINILNWMYGGENWVITDTYQIHNDWGRNYKQDLRKIQYNFIISSYLVGGKKYSDYVKNNYAKEMPKELYEQLLSLLSSKREEIESIGISLDTLLNKFEKEGIDY